MRIRSRTLAIAATVAALVLAACGGSEDPSSDGDDSAGDDGEAAEADGTEDQDEVASDPEADAGADTEDEPADDAGEDQGAETGSDLLSGVSFTAEPLKVEYSIEGDQQGMPASMTIAHDGARVATYTTVEQSGSTMETAAFIDGGEGVAFCFKESDTWACFEQGDMQGQMGGMQDDLIEDTSVEEGELADYLADPYRDEIAGREAICGTNRGFEQSGGGDVCVDAKTGVLLRLELDAGTGERMIMEAVSVTAASEADFTPPAEPGSFGG